MLQTSQNREAVFQASFANVREVVLVAAVAHRKVVSKHRYGMRRTRRPLGTPMRSDSISIDSDRRLSRGDWQSPAGCGMGSTLHPRLWASLVLSKMSRG
jgi:hypothetical protein